MSPRHQISFYFCLLMKCFLLPAVDCDAGDEWFHLKSFACFPRRNSKFYSFRSVCNLIADKICTNNASHHWVRCRAIEMPERNVTKAKTKWKFQKRNWNAFGFRSRLVLRASACVYRVSWPFFLRFVRGGPVHPTHGHRILVRWWRQYGECIQKLLSELNALWRRGSMKEHSTVAQSLLLRPTPRNSIQLFHRRQIIIINKSSSFVAVVNGAASSSSPIRYIV